MGRVGWVGWGFTCTHVTCYGLDVSCTCTHVTCYASHGRVGWVGWAWWRFFHLHTCDMLRTWRFLHLHTCDMLRSWRFLHLDTCDMLWTWKSESKRRSVKFASGSLNRMQFTKWHSKTRRTGTQALDKVWSHLTKRGPKSLCSRSKSDRRFHPRMEQYVYSYMWRFNNRPKLVDPARTIVPTTLTKGKHECEWRFFFGASYFPI